MRVVGGFFCLLALLGCGQQQRSEALERDPYHFNDRPYDTIQGIDKDLYNYLFNIIKNKLIYYVLESNLQASEPFGVVLELDISWVGRGFSERRGAPAIRGWFLFEKDILPVDEVFLLQYRTKTLSDQYRDLAKALFWVEKQNLQTYKVFVRYWNKTVIHEFLHEVRRQEDGYRIVHTVIP